MTGRWKISFLVALCCTSTATTSTADALPPRYAQRHAPPTIVLEAGGAPKLRPITTAALSVEVADLRAVVDNGTGAVETRIEQLTARPDADGGAASRAMLWLRACRCRGPATLPGRVELFDAAGRLVATAPFVAEIEPAPWICWGPPAAGLSGCLLAGLLIGPLLRSRFLPSPPRLARTLLGVRWTNDYGKREEADEVEVMVRGMMARALRPTARLMAWLRANPLRLVWPGRLYLEALSLSLSSRPGQGTATLNRVRDLPSTLHRSPDRYRGGLYVVADPEGEGVRYYAVPDPEGRVGSLYLENARRSRAARPELIRRARHLDSEPYPRPAPGLSAGWRIMPATTDPPKRTRRPKARPEIARAPRDQWWTDRRGPGNG